MFWVVGILTIETSMRTGKPILIAVIAMDVETTEAIHPFKLAKAIERYLASSSDELKKLGSFFLVK